MRLFRVTLAAVLLLPATACAPFGDDGAEKAAKALAAALGKYDVSGVAVTDPEARSRLRDLLEPLASYPSQVTVGEVTEDDRGATATLRWRTDLGREAWQHETTARLREAGEEWQVAVRPDLVESSLEDGERLSIATVKSARGRILGAGGAPIVQPRPVLRIGLDKTKVPPARVEQSARELARVLDVDADKLVTQAKAAGPKAFVEALVVRRDGLAPDFALQWGGIAGAVGLSDHRPLAPSRAFARQLLGVVGPATAEILKESKGRLSAGDEAGLSGLQRRYDEQLGGRSGRVVSAVAEDGTRRELFRVEPEAGTDLRITLDPLLQQRADDLVAETASDSALVAIRPSTGEVLAAASGPTDNGYNTATFGRYPPGSTFKAVSALALLRAGLEPDAPVSCPATTTVDGKRFKNYSDYPASELGEITLARAIAHSCNTAFIGQRERVTGDLLPQAAAALGLGVDHDLGFPAYFGEVPPPASETEAAADLIGQGKVTASPLAMATVLASVVKGGTVVPSLLPDRASAADPESPLTPEETRHLRQMLRGVVDQGSGAGLQGVADMAKTGTAEFGDATRTHAWMIGSRGDLAVAVFVAEGESGSRTAGPILRDFLSRSPG